MVVIQSSKGTTNHRIAKMPWTVVRHNPARERLPDPEVPRSPRDLIAQFQETARAPTDRNFAGADGGT
ncbi:MAG: hypothetical protein DMD81_18805, partial [Candidatus Rokuibacteriota bacterium]